MRINVTQEHISKGVARNVSSCPIALASGGKVADTVIWLGGKAYVLPKAAQVFISRFDRNIDVEPFSFRVGKLIPAWEREILFKGSTDFNYEGEVK